MEASPGISMLSVDKTMLISASRWLTMCCWHCVHILSIVLAATWDNSGFVKPVQAKFSALSVFVSDWVIHIKIVEKKKEAGIYRWIEDACWAIRPTRRSGEYSSTSRPRELDRAGLEWPGPRVTRSRLRLYITINYIYVIRRLTFIWDRNVCLTYCETDRANAHMMNKAASISYHWTFGVCSTA